jgi:trehalose 6-phosphate phosphatase
MTLPAPPALDLDHALFLDMDGTLAPIEATPDAVAFRADRAILLDRLQLALGGALAILSGRTLADIDRVLGPGRAAGAIHGLVRRLPGGRLLDHEAGPGLAQARATLQALPAAYPGVILEDKGLSLAVHFRQVPDVGQTICAAVAAIAAETGMSQQAGDMVCELRTPGPDKGAALAAFMAEPPFAGRIPVAVGDDLTDEHAFRAAEELGGFGVLVGGARATVARYGLTGVDAVLDWLGAGLPQKTF